VQRGWHLRNRCQQRGIGFIEILITIALLSIGFLALARMQVEGMRFSQSAYFQSQAYFLASDMINRMRTNTDGVRDGHYDNIEHFRMCLSGVNIFMLAITATILFPLSPALTM